MVISHLTELGKKLSIDSIDICNLLFNIREFEVGNQLKNACSSIVTNIIEASEAEDEKEYMQKLHITINECNECIYWLDIIRLGVILDSRDLSQLYEYCYSIARLIKDNIKTANYSPE